MKTSKISSQTFTCEWRPLEHSKLLKSLLCHYIIWPITSYTNLISIVETYIYDHAKRLRLELYTQDPTVKTVVHDLLMTENSTVRGTIRKLQSAQSASRYHGLLCLDGHSVWTGRWEQQVIQQDNNRYDRFGTEMTARSQEEIDAAMPSAADREEDDNNSMKDRDVTVDNLSGHCGQPQ
ncbi:hypothetical protein DFH08DRAFT_820389 [Mycena albidolilacea]|uniref:Uncharacterized protein n=1 Tax=Mycena albidolilacea TaxID=1033008 RepID=A0AAD7EFR1_9AGAR|nr:hypothetical protein DFH08DRAFT_820389 [Mycena albidolilacea]